MVHRTKSLINDHTTINNTYYEINVSYLYETNHIIPIKQIDTITEENENMEVFSLERLKAS